MGIENALRVEGIMSLISECEPPDMGKKKASEALPRMPTTKRSMLNDYSES